MRRRINDKKLLQVELLEAKPHPMFTEWQRATLRFLRYSQAVACAECGKRSKHHWTSLFAFQAMDTKGKSFVLRSKTGKVHPPLTPVCRNHPMSPDPKAIEEVPDEGEPNESQPGSETR